MEPEYYRTYRQAWVEHRICTDDKRKEELERIMDDAQNNFTYSEFQAFKKTLPGYQAFWNYYYQEGLKVIEKWKDNNVDLG